MLIAIIAAMEEELSCAVGSMQDCEKIKTNGHVFYRGIYAALTISDQQVQWFSDALRACRYARDAFRPSLSKMLLA